MRWKRFQRALFNLLNRESDCVRLFLSLCILFLFLLSTTLMYYFGNGERVWRKAYDSLANPFTDNISGKSFKKDLCAPIPIDAVYTWVNGSDPIFLDGLKHLKERLLPSTSLNEPLCSYSHCVPSRFLSTNRTLSPDLAQLKFIRPQNPFLATVLNLSHKELSCERHIERRTFLEFANSDLANRAHSSSKGIFSIGVNVFPLVKAYWTSDWTAPRSFPYEFYVMLIGIPPTATKEKIINSLPERFSLYVDEVILYLEERLVILEFTREREFNDFMLESKANGGFFSFGSTKAWVKRANIVVELPKHSYEPNISPSRFEDNDELRYSLRSLEKYAPWIRKVFIVTDGQIPSWLDTHNPKVRLITHREIFSDETNLPTFSSSAIEANLYKIPDLSDKFLYFNDDVFLGKEIWPSDFFTEDKGFSIPLSWELPDCAPGCPQAWLSDGFCDSHCNNTRCMRDGGDCLGSNVTLGNFGGVEDIHVFNWTGQEPPCSAACLDFWLSDGFCDSSCDVKDCGFDGGDCGLKKLDETAHLLARLEPNRKTWSFRIPNNLTVAYWDLGPMYEEFKDLELIPFNHHAVRSLSLLEKVKVLVVILYPNKVAALKMSLVGKNSESTLISFNLTVTCNTVNFMPSIQKIETKLEMVKKELDHKHEGKNDDLNHGIKDSSFYLFVDPFKLNLESSKFEEVYKLQSAYKSGRMSEVQYFTSLKKILKHPLYESIDSGKNWEDILVDGMIDQMDRKIFDRHFKRKSRISRSLLSVKDANSQTEEYIHRSVGGITIDTYAKSLLHTQEIFYERYGKVTLRNAPSHMPLLIDKLIFESMTEEFIKQWKETSSTPIRSERNMQLSFSYFSFIMSEKKKFDAREIFRQFDTDRSATWSDREIRLVLPHIFNGLISLEKSEEFNSYIIDCARRFPETIAGVSPLPFERYRDNTNMPVVTESLIVRCPEIKNLLKEAFPDNRRYKFQTDYSPEAELKKIGSDVSAVIAQLDDLRKYPKKFFCLNDDKKFEVDNSLVNSIVIDYLESVLPQPSSFELDSNLRNRFRYVSEYEEVYYIVLIYRFIVYACIVMTILLFISVIFKLDLSLLYEKLVDRLRIPIPQQFNV